ncbi:alpha-lytic protease prodomain-containing protein [Streptomyces hydrogenans]|uniref:alpha-lytic protease prodomain-containing protein n=1 Tax=Streptomyces hydrogenans TaxID=1873719 RepID=UPI003821B49A
MMRDLHLSGSDLDRRITQEADATRTALKARLGDRLAGVWFDAKDGRLHTAVSTKADASTSHAAGAVAHQVPHSKAALDKALASIPAQAPAAPGATSRGPDVQSNRIEVTADPSRTTEATSTFLHTLDSYGDLVHLTESAYVPRPQGGVAMGGEKWYLGTNRGYCSIGFCVTRPDKSTAYLTAGHCTSVVSLTAYGKDSTRLGTSNKNCGGSINGSEGDMGPVDVDQTDWELSAKVSGWGTKSDTVTDAADKTSSVSVTCTVWS